MVEKINLPQERRYMVRYFSNVFREHNHGEDRIVSRGQMTHSEAEK